jgi:hypothetical protein
MGVGHPIKRRAGVGGDRSPLSQGDLGQWLCGPWAIGDSARGHKQPVMS